MLVHRGAQYGFLRFSAPGLKSTASAHGDVHRDRSAKSATSGERADHRDAVVDRDSAARTPVTAGIAIITIDYTAAENHTDDVADSDATGAPACPANTVTCTATGCCNRTGTRTRSWSLCNRNRRRLSRCGLDFGAHVRLLDLDGSWRASRRGLVLCDPLRLRDTTRRRWCCSLDRRNDLDGGLSRRQGYLARRRSTLEILHEVITDFFFAAAGGQRQRAGYTGDSDDRAHVVLHILRAVSRRRYGIRSACMVYPDWQWPVRCTFPLRRLKQSLFLSTQGDNFVSKR